MNTPELPAIQFGEPFHCWECAAIDQGGMYLIIRQSPLERYAEHIYYLRLSCRHNPRCVRLGDAILPLPPLDGTLEDNLAMVRSRLAALAAALAPAERSPEPVTRLVYQLLASRISPNQAIQQLQELLQQPAG